MTSKEIREMQRGLIRQFLEDNKAYLNGRVLDFGCGDQPYKDVVESAGGSYIPYNRPKWPGTPYRDHHGPDSPLSPEHKWDAILCTQVTQYLPNPAFTFSRMSIALQHTKGYLVLTFATNWPEVELEDLFRFTATGMAQTVDHAGFNIVHSRQLGAIPFGDFESLPLGGGLIAHPR